MWKGNRIAATMTSKNEFKSCIWWEIVWLKYLLLLKLCYNDFEIIFLYEIIIPIYIARARACSGVREYRARGDRLAPALALYSYGATGNRQCAGENRQYRHRQHQQACRHSRGEFGKRVYREDGRFGEHDGKNSYDFRRLVFCAHSASASGEQDDDEFRFEFYTKDEYRRFF
jgi:hypothetical protein